MGVGIVTKSLDGFAILVSSQLVVLLGQGQGPGCQITAPAVRVALQGSVVEFLQDDPRLPAEQQQMVKMQLRQLKAVEDPAKLEQILQQLYQQKASVPPSFGKALDLMEKWLKDRIEELSSGGGEAPAEGGA